MYKLGHVTLVAIKGTTKLTPYHFMKPLQIICSGGTKRFYQMVPNFQLSSSGLSRMVGYQANSASYGH